ncbi:hypothetical protein MNV49_000302 [Pseudohyphozyma bogoriensis]|nr:hypothetical protein MNV49_000302 [Pseudohyphozyma bogoriensis]
MLDSVLSTAAGVALLAGAGILYHWGYKSVCFPYDVLRKMRRAFEPGYDPVLELANASMYVGTGVDKKQKPGRIRRREQDFVDALVRGDITGEYILMLGPKGTGKTSLLVEAMLANDADGVAMVEAHEDPEVFRLRFGKALDFEFSEDSFAGLFQRRDPREAGPLLDIERALNKLEKVAIKFRKEKGRPLCLIYNNIHFIHDDEDGHSLLHMLQQRAESWAQAGVVTTIFSSDSFAPYVALKKNSTRMHVLAVQDLTPTELHACLAPTRASLYPSEPPLDPAVSFKIWDLLGGRLSTLSKISNKPEMVAAAEEIIEREKGWLNHKLGLIPDHDDDVMDEQKVSSCSFLLFQEFARLAEEDKELMGKAYEELVREVAGKSMAELQALPISTREALSALPDPKVNYRSAREIMTRPDYIIDLDHHNIINVDVNYQLDNVRDRVDEIESLHRTSELTVKSDNDLGGILRLRIGKLSQSDPDEEKDDGGDGKDGP